MSDADFKKSQVIGFEEYKLEEDWGEFYKPDLVFTKDKIIIFLESSSTGDRKPHVGELTQFLSFVNCNYNKFDEFYYVLILCGNGKSPPKDDRELKRLQFFYDRFALLPCARKKIKGIYVKNQESATLSIMLEEIQNYTSIIL